jgi:hypothetical protein
MTEDLVPAGVRYTVSYVPSVHTCKCGIKYRVDCADRGHPPKFHCKFTSPSHRRRLERFSFRVRDLLLAALGHLRNKEEITA